jgi:hypothetical protein
VSPCVDALVEPVQSPTGEAVADRFLTQAKSEKLLPSHHPVLATSNRGRLPVVSLSQQSYRGV